MADPRAQAPFRAAMPIVAILAAAISPAAAAVVAPFQVPSQAQVSAPAPGAPPTPAATSGTILKRFPAGREQLIFRGEMASRTFPVVLGRTEAARTTTLQLALRNTVLLLPDLSTLTVAINGQTLAALPATAADKPTILSVAIPPGLLKPGSNTVQITAVLTHRVDCSVPATYELWAALDPAQTGFVVPADAADPLASIADLAAAPLAEDGTTRIHVRAPDGVNEAFFADAALAVQRLVAGAKLRQPVVEVGTGVGEGPGFDLVLAAPGSAETTPSNGDGLSVARDEATGRLTVEASANGAEPPTASRETATDRDGTFQGGFRRTLAQLGRNTEVFMGRHYRATIPVVLPSDFMSTNDRARLLLDGSHSAALLRGDSLSLWINGALVTSMSLSAGRAERFNHRELELPLRFFHPGHNDVTLDATTLAEADGQCMTATMPREARLTILGSSELVFPGFAHLTTIPQIPVAMAAGDAWPVYLPGADPATIGAALTVLANMAAQGRPAVAPHVVLGSADEEASPGLLIAATDQLPGFMASSLRRIAPGPAAGAREAGSADPDPDAVPKPAEPASREQPSDAAARVSSLIGTARSLLRDRGFFFGDDETNGLQLKPDDLLVAAVVPAGKAPGGEEADLLPKFTQDAAHWLVITAATPAALEKGLDALVSSGGWSRLRGEATRFDPTTDALDVRQPSAVTYVLSPNTALSDLRPIMGAVLSGNAGLSLIVLLVVLSILGVSTHAVIHRMGVR